MVPLSSPVSGTFIGKKNARQVERKTAKCNGGIMIASFPSRNASPRSALRGFHHAHFYGVATFARFEGAFSSQPRKRLERRLVSHGI